MKKLFLQIICVRIYQNSIEIRMLSTSHRSHFSSERWEKIKIRKTISLGGTPNKVLEMLVFYD